MDLPKRVPVLPLRDVVLFPGVTMPLFVGRRRSVAAIEAGVENGGPVLALTQRRADLSEPAGRDLYRVGTLAAIRESTRLPDGTMRVVVCGLARVRLRRLLPTDRILEGSISRYPDADPPDDTSTSGLRSDVLSLFQEYVSLRDRLPADIYEVATKLSDPSALSLFVAGHLASGVAVRQRLLETEGWLPRLRLLSEMLTTDIQILRVEKRRPRADADRLEVEFGDEGRRAPVLERSREDEDDLEELREAISRAEMPKAVQAKALREINRLARMNAMSPEATVSRTYIDWLVSLPWQKRTADRLDLEAAQAILDSEHYGLRSVKDRILEYISVVKLAERIRGPVLCLVGPPGVGKTSLGHAIANALGRQFVRMSLGGIRDEAEIRGHRRTYIGSMPGRIVQAMRRAGVVNPLILLDEVDKLGADYRGDPAAALLEVLDPEQNHAFQDHYLDADYDLSNAMFVTTANGLTNIHPALLDRMEVLRLPGYLEHEKLAIAKRFLLPRQLSACGLDPSDLSISDGALKSIVRERTREAGVRNLEREIGTLCRRAARRRAGDREAGPLVVTRSNLSRLLGAPRFTSNEVVTRNRIGVATGLAWTEGGGEILNVEVTLLPGKGRLILTGKLGETMQESGRAALSYIRSRTELLGLDPDFNERVDIHVHMAQAGVPKDGPSAGITMALAMVSALTGTPTRVDVGLTGEITLRGTVLPVGGLGEKLMAARRTGIRCVIAPDENAPQIDDLPRELKRGLDIVRVRDMDEVIEYGLDGRLSASRVTAAVAACAH